jgi:type VI secretion system protein ImpF
MALPSFRTNFKMARTDNEIRITPSVLDRLLDFEPKSSKEAPKSRLRSLNELKQSVKRDLEWLLNSRAYPGNVDEKLEEVRKSVAVYGLPDFTGVSAKNYKEQTRLSAAIEDAIKYFEPRFIDLKVSLEPVSNVDKALKFHIEAQLDIEPTPEPIAFDTVLELGSGEFSVKEK